MKNCKVLLMLCLALGSFAFAKNVKHGQVYLLEQRNTVELDYDKTYVTYLKHDIVTVITFPKGFVLASVIPGSKHYVSAKIIQNYVNVTRPVNEDKETNLIVNIITPEGNEEKVIFRFASNKNNRKVLGVHFEYPEYSRCNRVVETIKAQYADQMENRLTVSLKENTSTVYDNTMIGARMLFFGNHRNKSKARFKGVAVYIEGVILTESDAFIYLKSNSDRKNCEVVILESVSVNREKYSVERVSLHEDGNGIFQYVYKMSKPEITKKRKMIFEIKIWSKSFKIKTNVS